MDNVKKILGNKMTLFEECMEALGKEAITLEKKDADKIFEKMKKDFPITFYGRIDWDKVQHKKILDLIELTKEIDSKEEVYILWNNASLPVVKTILGKVLEFIEDVVAVSFDTWVYSPKLKFIIEFYHEGEVTFGYK